MILSSEATTTILKRLRLAAIAGQLATIAYAAHTFGAALDVHALLGIVFIYSLWHAVFLWQQTTRQLTDARLTVEITIDVAVITALLCVAGGWTNPFSSVYLVPLGFAAAMLTLDRALWVVAAAFCGYVITILAYVPLPELEPHHGSHGSMHLMGMWMSFVLAGSVLVVTVAFVRSAFESERRALAQTREARLRDEHVLSLGVLAASTAHEIGTPLATARLIAEDLLELPGEVSPADARNLCTQLDYAIATLRQLRKSVRETTVPNSPRWPISHGASPVDCEFCGPRWN
ncbi:MAG: hypothetical protein HC809_00700 [Gammaproteobacteria bacterium]|nr:hypothetical protein [Gammaproteobacteria bacterium]